MRVTDFQLVAPRADYRPIARTAEAARCRTFVPSSTASSVLKTGLAGDLGPVSLLTGVDKGDQSPRDDLFADIEGVRSRSLFRLLRAAPDLNVFRRLRYATAALTRAQSSGDSATPQCWGL